MCIAERSLDDEILPVDYDDPEGQLVDFGSRFGVWWDPECPHFGIDHGAISSQREGKHFMAPLARLGAMDVDSGEMLFRDLGERRPVGYPWGFVQEGEVDSIRLRVTVACAGLDVVVVRIEVENTGETARHLRLLLQARPVPEDSDKKVVFHKADREVITTQTSAPTSCFQVRPEPHIDIVTGWRTDFNIDWPHEEDGGFSVEGDTFFLPAGKTRVFSIYVSAASGDSSTADGLMPLVRHQLESQTGPPEKVIRDAKDRWEAVFRALPADTLRQRWADTFQVEPDETLDASTPAAVHRAMMILLRNTIRPQPTQGYGEMMGSLRGTFPCRYSYEGFWIWDSAFQALAFSEWDLDLAKENIRLMLHNQTGEGGLPMLHPDATVPSAQPPLLSWVAMEIYEKEQAKDPEEAEAFLDEIYPELALWNEWWFRHRDKNGNGLAEWGNNLESGWDDSPRWDNADGPAGWNNDHGATRFEAVDLNAYLIKDMRCLGRMAEASGRVHLGRRWIREADELARRVVDVLYDPQDNLFYDTDCATGERRKVLTPASFLPLWAGVPLPEARVRDMIETYLLSPEHFFGHYPFPTVSYREQAHDASGYSGYWRGPIWLNIAYFMIEILAWHGYKKEAQTASRKILEMVGHAGIHENYNARTGERGDNSRMDFSWSAAMAIAIATGDLTHARPPRYREDHLAGPTVHIGLRVRDRKIYGRGKEASIHLTNRTNQTVSGTLSFRLPKGWNLRIHDAAAGPEEGWIDAAGGLPFRLEPGAGEERPVRFVIPASVHLGDDERVGIEAVADGNAPVRLGWTVLRLEGPSGVPLPWPTEETAADFWPLLHAGGPFHFVHDGGTIGQSAAGLVGMLNSRLQFLGRQALARHMGQRDFIKYLLHLVRRVPAAAPLRRKLENLLSPSFSPQTADEEARQILETVVQRTRDVIGG